MTEIVIARRDGTLRSPSGERYRLLKGKTLADARHPAVVAFPEDWRPVEIALDVPAGEGLSAAEITEDELTELRTELAEATETVEHLGAQFRRLIDGLLDRGVELPDEDAREQGWLVSLTLAAFDDRQRRIAEPVSDVEPTVAERLADRDRKLSAGEVVEAEPEHPTGHAGTTVAEPEPVAAPPRPRKRTVPKPKSDG